MRLVVFTLFWCISITTLTQSQAQQSVLRSGNWFKLAVDKHGVYKINFDLLKKMGVDVGKIDPRKIKIYGYGGGMLPQPNQQSRPVDLIENAVLIEGESDGKFDKEDFILFYAEGPDKISFDVARDIYHYQKNLYSDRNFYFLTISEDNGKRVGISPDLGNGFPIINEFNDCIFYESDKVKLNEPKSGREWYGEKFGINTLEHTLSFSVGGISSSQPIKMVSDVLGQSYDTSSMRIFVNDVLVRKQGLLAIPNTRYGVKGIHKRDTFLINTSTAKADIESTQDIKYHFTKAPGSSEAYLDFFLLSFLRKLALYNTQTSFVSRASLNQAISQFEITFPEAISIWDVTDPSNVMLQNFEQGNGVAAFSTPTGQLKRFVAFTNNIEVPAFIEKISNQNLHGLTTPNLIIVTNPAFKNEALQLASHRKAFNQWRVEVVTPEEIFNEFSSGRQDVSAIRDFVKHLYDKDPSSLKALLLFGKCSYDYKDRVPKNTNFVMTYESRNSLHPLQTYGSDDYFGFLENNEGQWSEDPSQNHTLDIGVGRLPVTTVVQANGVVDKIIEYDTSKKAQGYWRKQIVFVADDGNGEDGYNIIHQSQADELGEYIEDLNPAVDTRKLFIGSYTKTIKANGETVPKLTDDIIRSFDRGTLIINYTGHGSEKQWADEKIFSDVTIRELENKLYPFMVTATCEFGRHDNPGEISSAELSVVQKEAGVIGLVTTTRPVNSTTNFNLNEAFYEALFQRADGVYATIGEVFRKTKNNSTSGVANRNFALLGDPSLTLALPNNSVHVNEIKTSSGSDTLKALSTVVAKGEILDYNGEKITSFNGILEATLFDKETEFVTSGKNDSFAYKQWYNALFRGKASVINGEFTLEFVIPKNIAYQVAQGKLSLYAKDPTIRTDAMGAFTGFKIGESEPDVIAEAIPPQIQLFMGDTTFVNGGITTPDTRLVAHITDNTGINISSYGIGNNILAILDNDVDTYILNDYYVADTDKPSSGWIEFPIKDLTPGRHRLSIKVWDVFNNSSEASIDFIVTDGESIVIESFGNYPNPFQENTTLFFTHNRSGDDLQAQVFIHDLTGEILKSSEIMITGSDYRVEVMEINSPDDFGKKLAAGLYLARVVVRSLTNGSKNEQVTKLIILN